MALELIPADNPRMAHFERQEPQPGLIVYRFPPTYSDMEFDAYLADLTSLLQRPGRRALVMDSRDAGRPSTAQRNKQAGWMKQHRERIAEVTVGIAFVMDSAVMRFVLSSIFLLQGMPAPYCVVGELPEAIDWARGQLNATRGDGAHPSAG